MSVSGEIPEIDRQIDIQHIIFYGLILVFVGDLVVYEEKWESKCSDRQMDRHATYYGLIGVILVIMVNLWVICVISNEKWEQFPEMNRQTGVQTYILVK